MSEMKINRLVVSLKKEVTLAARQVQSYWLRSLMLLLYLITEVLFPQPVQAGLL